ncbi:MAG: hypothetical protein ACKOXK_04505 [Chakrabartia sp.]
MRVAQTLSLFLSAALLVQASAPVAAEVFYKPPEIPARPMTAPEPGFDEDLPEATETEQRAALVWSLRQGLLLGALQCHVQYPTLLTTTNYNALLTNHSKELMGAYKALSGYFRRTVKGAVAAQDALDRYATRSTTVYSTVRGQQTFCYTAGWLGRKALSTPRGGLAELAMAHLGELRDSLKGGRDQQFYFPIVHDEVPVVGLPPLDKKCWTKKDEFNFRKCPEGNAG